MLDALSAVDLVGHATLAIEESASYPSHLAIDGNPHTKMYGSSCWQNPSSNQENPWWSVDLGDEMGVTAVRIVSRTDCCGRSHAVILT